MKKKREREGKGKEGRKGGKKGGREGRREEGGQEPGGCVDKRAGRYESLVMLAPRSMGASVFHNC